MSKLEDKLEFQLKALKVPPFQREYRFHSVRQWKADFGWQEHKLLVEVEGGQYLHYVKGKDGKPKKSRHLSPEGYQNDCEKYNTAQVSGWKVLRFTTSQVQSGTAATVIGLFFATNKAWCPTCQSEAKRHDFYYSTRLLRQRARFRCQNEKCKKLFHEDGIESPTKKNKKAA